MQLPSLFGFIKEGIGGKTEKRGSTGEFDPSFKGLKENNFEDRVPQLKGILIESVWKEKPELDLKGKFKGFFIIR